MMYLLIAMMVATLAVLLVGIGFMMKGGEANRKYSNKLMVLRVSCQAGALAMLGLMFLVGK